MFKKLTNIFKKDSFQNMETIVFDIYNIDTNKLKKYLYFDDLYQNVIVAIYNQNFDNLPRELFYINNYGRLLIKDKDFYQLFKKSGGKDERN